MFLRNSRRSVIRCGRSAETDTAGLIPKLRPLFCRVPWGAITRSPWSSRPGHLCRFWGTVLRTVKLEVFLGSVLPLVHPAEAECPVFTRYIYARIFLKRIPHDNNGNPITRKRYNPPSLRHLFAKSWNINHVSIGSGFRHSLRPD